LNYDRSLNRDMPNFIYILSTREDLPSTEQYTSVQKSYRVMCGGAMSKLC
jgi:hypothetical protein